MSRSCVAIARPYAPRISGVAPDSALLSGTPGLRFRAIADMLTPARHAGKDTANAVRVHALPGFKSPSLRSSLAPYPDTWGGGRAASLDP